MIRNEDEVRKEYHRIFENHNHINSGDIDSYNEGYIDALLYVLGYEKKIKFTHKTVLPSLKDSG